MFDYLNGTITHRGATRLTLDVGGVGYALLVPLCSSFPTPGGDVRVWVHFVVRETAQTLYGFEKREHRDLFRELLKVKGVGPTMALALLSGLPPGELVAAILASDLVSLTQVKGVGKKTAEQILLDLRDRAESLAAGLGLEAEPKAPLPGSTPADPAHTDAIAALVSLGFTEKDARRRVQRVASAVGPGDVGALVQAAFRS